MKKQIFILIALIIGISLSAQIKEIEISGGASYGRLKFAQSRIRPDASVLFSLYKDDRITLFSGLRFDDIQYKTKYYYDSYFYGSSSSYDHLDYNESKYGAYILALPLQLNVNIAKENNMSFFVGVAYKYIFGDIYKSKDVYESGKIEENKRSAFFKEKLTLKYFLVDYQLGFRIKLFGNDKIDMKIMPLYEVNVVSNPDRLAEIVMHGFSLNLSLNLKFNRHE